MKLTIKDPYSVGEINILSDGTTLLQRNPLIYTPQLNDILHKVKEFDRLDLLAFKYYGDSKWWWVIADVNDNVFDPFDLPISEDIIIPNLEIIKTIIR